GCDVMAEAVFTREEVEELARHQTTAVLTLTHAPLVRLSEYLLVRDRPGDARDRRRQHEQPHDLCREREIRSGHASAAIARLTPAGSCAAQPAVRDGETTVRNPRWLVPVLISPL